MLTNISKISSWNCKPKNKLFRHIIVNLIQKNRILLHHPHLLCLDKKHHLHLHLRYLVKKQYLLLHLRYLVKKQDLHHHLLLLQCQDKKLDLLVLHHHRLLQVKKEFLLHRLHLVELMPKGQEYLNKLERRNKILRNQWNKSLGL